MACDKPVLKVCSWKVKGIHNPVKRRKIRCFLKKEHVHIAFLQETHLSQAKHSKVTRDLVGQVFSSCFTSNSRGVTILVSKHLPLSEVTTISDKAGRYVMAISLLNILISLLNILPSGTIN